MSGDQPPTDHEAAQNTPDAGLLAESEAQFRTVFENMREGAALHEIIYGPQGQAVDYRLVNINRAFERNTGIKVELARGALASQLYGISPPPLLDIYDRVARSGRSCSFETFVPSLQRHFAISACSPRQGWFATIFYDVTERRWAWDLLRRSETNLARAQSIAHLGSWHWDFQNNAVTWSAEMYRIHGVDPNTFQIMPDALGQLIHPDDRGRYEQALAELRQGRTVETMEYRAVRPDGEIRVIQVSGSEIEQDGSGAPHQVFGTVLDITERKQVEDALRMTQFSVDHAADEIFWIGPDGRIVNVNESACRSLGCTREELLRLTIPDIDPDFDSAHWSTYWENLKTAGTLHFEGRHRARDGRHYPVEITANHIQFGGKDYSCAFVHDITERRQAEELLRMTQFSVDHAVDGIFWTGPDARIVNVNEAACALLGYTREELLRFSIWDISPRTTPERWQAIWAELKARGSWQIENLHQAKDGRLIPVEIAANYLNYGGREYSCAFMRDITERKRVGDALQETSQRLRLATAAGQLGVWDEDLKAGVLIWDDRMYELYGTSRESFSPSFEAWRRTLHPDDVARVMAEVQAAYDGVKDFDTAFRIVRPDGTIRTIRANSQVIRDEGGRPTRITGLNRDITEQRQMEEQLRQSQKMEAIGQLAGGIAHDFNNLLTGILGYANMLKLESTPASTVFDAAQTIERAAERASELTQKLLGFARRGKFLAVAVDLNDIVREVIALLSRTIDKNISITQRLGADDPAVLGDPGQIQQVVLNLAINARDAMSGGGELIIQTGVEALEEGFCRLLPGLTPGRHAVITVSDTGCGIPAEVRDRIFEPFFTTKEQGKGTGMGLAMVYGIVKNHGGHIGVDSEPQRGSRFRVYLPLHAAAAAAARPASPPAPLKGAGRVLVVDDEAVILKVAGKMLKSLGYEVLTASGGHEAVRLCAEQDGRIDLALIDMVMPQMDGQATFRALRERIPDLKAILSSGFGIDGRAQAILDDGMEGFIQKPYKMSELAEIVAKALSES